MTAVHATGALILTAAAVTMCEPMMQPEPTDDAMSEIEEAEVVDGLLDLAPVRAIEPYVPTVLPAVQAIAVAATGFVAGAATVALVRRHSTRKLARARIGRRQGSGGLPIVGTRSFLVDVHLIAKPGE